LLLFTEEVDIPITRETEPSRRGSSTGSSGGDDGARGVLPSAVDAAESGGAQRGQMHVHTVNKPIKVQEMATRFEKTMDCRIARENLLSASKIVEGDSRNHQVERPSEILRPGWIRQVGKNIRDLTGVVLKTPPRLLKHRR
jgi:hypothetical protein